MSGFGDPLKEAREARGLSLEAVAEATRIPRHHLAALERSDIEALPAGPFAKGYIEAYGKLLDIDPEPILEAYRAEGRRRGLGTPDAQDRVIEELSHLVEQRSGTTEHPGGRAARWKGLVIVSIAAGLLAIGGWLGTRGRTPDEPVATSPRPPAPASPGAVDESEASPRSAETPRRSESEAPSASSLAAERGSAPSPVPRATPEPAEARANPNIEISDSGLGTGVENHRLVGQADRFPEGSEVVFWTRVLGGDPGNVILHVWLHEGRGIARIPLTVGGSHWRTHSVRPLPRGSAGRWTVEARSPDGGLLARQEFLCVPRDR